MDRLNPHSFNRDTDTQSLLPHTTKMCLSVKEIKYKLKGPVLEAPNPPSRKISLHFQSLEVKPDLLSFNPMSILGHVSGYKSFSLCSFLFFFFNWTSKFSDPPKGWTYNWASFQQMLKHFIYQRAVPPCSWLQIRNLPPRHFSLWSCWSSLLLTFKNLTILRRTNSTTSMVQSRLLQATWIWPHTQTSP